jgi:TatD DNase family protein
MELIDTHCHLTSDEFSGSLDAVLARSAAAGTSSWITVGTDPADCRLAIGLSEGIERMYAAVGIHPHFADNVTAAMLAELSNLAKSEKVVAIGETGLDFFRNIAGRRQQLRLFAWHLSIARRLNLPVIVHCRDAFEETLEVLQRHGGGIKAVFHCFTGTAAQAAAVTARGFYVSFTGVITFRNAGPAQQAAATAPLERLMLETDCPYMSPEPVRKQKINEPANLVHTARFIAERRNLQLDELADRTSAVSTGFFNLPHSREESLSPRV